MEYRREVDGLRALAVLPVIFFHAGFQIFSGGFVGVDVFFVISGYLITSIIISEKQAGTFTLIDFYERRARRIMPGLFVVMLACVPFAWFWLLPQDMKSFSQSLVAVSVFSSNALFWLTSGYFETAAENKPLLHTWSLAVEEQYYVIFPVFMILAWRLGKPRVLAMLAVVAVISLTAAHYGSVANPVATFYLLPTRAWELLVGVFVAFYCLNENNWRSSRVITEIGSAVGLLLIMYAIFNFDAQTPFPSLYALVPTIGAALIILCASQKTAIGKLLSANCAVNIGLVSYGAYLWHQPLFAFARHRSLSEPSKFMLGVLAAAAVILAYFSWKYVETPFRSKQKFSRKQVFCFSAMGSGLFVVFGLFGYFANGFNQRFVDSQRIVANYSQYDFSGDYWGENCFVLSGGRTSKIKDLCLKRAAEFGSAVLWGDSHAAALSVGFRRIENNLLQYTTSACPPAVFTFVSRECSEVNEMVMSEMLKNSPRNIFIHAYWGAYNKNYILPQLNKSVSELRSALPEAQIIIIGSVPVWNKSLPDLVLNKALFLDGDVLIGNDKYDDLFALDKDLEQLAANRGVFFFSALDNLCNNGKCLGSFKDGEEVVLTAWDSNHITRGTATRLVEQLRKKTSNSQLDN